MTKRKKTTTTDPSTVEVKESTPMSNVLDEGIFEFDEDISDAELPPPFPDGTYNAEIMQVAVTLSKTSGKRMWVPDLVVPIEEYPNGYPVEEEPEGIRAKAYIIVGSPDRPSSAREKVAARRFCEAAGVTPSSSINMTDFMGKKVQVELVNEPGLDGVMRPNVKRILASK